MLRIICSRIFPNQVYHEYLKSSSKVKTEYGLRVEHIDGDLITIAVERPLGCVDWPSRFRSRDNHVHIVYDNPLAIPEKIKNRVRELFEIFSDESIVLKLLRELKDKYVVLAENGSPTTVAKTPYNVLKYGYMEGKPIHARSADGYSVDESSEAESDEAIVITSPEGIGVPLLAGKFELALSLLGGKPIGDIWKRNYDMILKNLDVKNDFA